MELYIQETGSKLRKKNDSFSVVKDELEKTIAPCQLDAIVVEGRVSITTDAIELAVENGIPIIITDELGTVLGKFWEAKFPSTPKIRRNQLKYFDTPFATEMAKKWLIKKMEFQARHTLTLERKSGFINGGSEKNIEKEINKIINCKGTPDETRRYIMECEARASERYYQLLRFNLPGTIGFQKREHQEAKDPYNVILNYIFGCLYKKIEHYMVLAGLEPYIGIFHTDGYNKASLVYDFAEMFRNISYEIAYSTAAAHEISKTFFKVENNRCTISPDMRKKLVKKFHDKLKGKIELPNGEKISVEEYMKQEIRKIVKELEEYKVQVEDKSSLKDMIKKIWE